MRPRAVPLLILALIGLAAVAAIARGAEQDPIYSVAALQAGVRHDPQGWAGRTVRVRGVILPELDPSCTAAGAPCFRLLLRDIPAVRAPATPPTPGASLALVAGPPDPLLGRLRDLPALGGLLPRPQELVFERAMVYRLRLERAQAGSFGCAGPPCYQGEVLDAAPALGGS